MAIEKETLEMPYIRPIPYGLKYGSEVKLEGFIPQNSKGFKACFRCAQFRGADIPFEFNLQFEGPPHSSSAVVTLSSRAKRERRKELKMPSTLRQGKSFAIRFIITSSGYKIIENDRVLTEFPHRLEPESIHFLVMDGQITLKILAGLSN
ncbi:galectin-4-like [Tiliqua scincoides]|uniref:galectin-4-like n=1 Tax=Tiliqua scincoides TaxID=71010 RepID=UPI003462090D